MLCKWNATISTRHYVPLMARAFDNYFAQRRQRELQSETNKDELKRLKTHKRQVCYTFLCSETTLKAEVCALEETTSQLEVANAQLLGLLSACKVREATIAFEAMSAKCNQNIYSNH